MQHQYTYIRIHIPSFSAYSAFDQAVVHRRLVFHFEYHTYYNFLIIMSSTITLIRQATNIPTTLKRQIAPPSDTADILAPTFIQLDTNVPTPTAPLDGSHGSPSATKAAADVCSKDSDCSNDRICSKGLCVSSVEAAPFGSPGGHGQEPTTHMTTVAAIGVGLGVVGLILILFGLGFWFWRRRGRKSPDRSIESPPLNRATRSASNATDQKTLVASMPNSPQNALFRDQHREMAPESFAKLNDSGDVTKEKYAHARETSSGSVIDRRSISTQKALPLPPNDMPLPPPPTEEKRYAINVNINKSMIFDDIMFATGSPRRDSETSRERMPKYRFEEYIPPVARRLSASQKTRSSKRESDFEMGPYPRESLSEAEASTDDEQKSETRSRRRRTLKKLEGGPPLLPLPELPPPSPSYDWYQDIIGTEKSDTEEGAVPSIPSRNPARTPTKATFGALSSNPPQITASTAPDSVSPTDTLAANTNSHLHPLSAALPSPATLTSPTAASFRLSPTVYTMPSRPAKAMGGRMSLQSNTTQQTRASRSWVPDDGLYLPEEGTHNSYMVFKRQLSDDSRPTSYSPLS